MGFRLVCLHLVQHLDISPRWGFVGFYTQFGSCLGTGFLGVRSGRLAWQKFFASKLWSNPFGRLVDSYLANLDLGCKEFNLGNIYF